MTRLDLFRGAHPFAAIERRPHLACGIWPGEARRPAVSEEIAC